MTCDYSWMLTTACRLAVGLGLGLWVRLSRWLMVKSSQLYLLLWELGKCTQIVTNKQELIVTCRLVMITYLWYFPLSLSLSRVVRETFALLFSFYPTAKHALRACIYHQYYSKRFCTDLRKVRHTHRSQNCRHLSVVIAFVFLFFVHTSRLRLPYELTDCRLLLCRVWED